MGGQAGRNDMSYYTAWCRARGCTHGHCSLLCQHPQPVGLEDGRLVCGRCLFVEGLVTEMAPCTPEVCDER